MEDHAMYRLKPSDELALALAGAGPVFIVACNKCFQEFTAAHEPECDALAALARAGGRQVTGAVRVDFLCGEAHALRRLRDAVPPGTESVFVISCGLGVQTVAGMLRLPVFAAADTIPHRGHHGMALTPKACDACAQCWLNLTGGICPVVDCAKGLLNGQCGGAKDGRCEVDPTRDCAWEKIHRRLKRLGRLGEFQNRPVQLRDYSRVNFKLINDYVREVRAKRFEGYPGGVYPSEHKEMSGQAPLLRFPEPDVVVIPLSMHAGSPAVPLVREGDLVRVGQKIGEQDGLISAPVHASVSGRVLAVEKRRHPVLGPGILSVVIQNDRLDRLDETVRPYGDPEALPPDKIVQIVKDKGIVGMGGAGFPAYLKLRPQKPVDTVLLNGCECEPMLTADHKLLLRYADEVICGLRAILKAVGAARGVIVLEDNKPDALALLREKTAAYEKIEVLAVRTKYPQGAERMLIKRVLGRTVPRGGLPADVGALVSNVSSAKAIADALCTGMPLIERVVCVTGERVRAPGNYIVKIGTSFRTLLDFCGGVIGDDVTIKMGGPMMGIPQPDLDVPVLKTTNGIIACEADHTAARKCIRCGRCADVCPIELYPLYLARYADAGDLAGLAAQRVTDCIECGCCAYICPSRIPLAAKIQAGKAAVREAR